MFSNRIFSHNPTDHDEVNSPDNVHDRRENVVSSQSNAQAVSCWRSLINELSSFCAPTWRRVLTWGVYGAMGGGLYYLQKEYDLWQAFEDGINEEIIPVMVLLYGYEPVMMTLQLLLAKYPQIKAQNVESSMEEGEALELEEKIAEEPASDMRFNSANIAGSHVVVEIQSPKAGLRQHFPLPYRPVMARQKSRNPELAVLIPCHNSAEVIERTIRSALRHVNPQQILILDNGKSNRPTDKTQAIVHAIHPDIHYVYLPETGNKSIAIFCGGHWAKRHGYPLSLCIDDDVCIPETYEINRMLFAEQRIKGLVYPILADTPSSDKSWVVKQQNLEYQFSDLEMAFLDRTKSVIRPHGAVSLFRTETLIEILEKHNAVFMGEDVLMGLILQHMKDEHGHSLLRIDMRFPFKTLVPEKYFGKGDNLFNQRVNSWNLAQYKYFWDLNLKPLLTIWCRPPLSILSIKNAQIYNIYSQLLHIVRYPIMAAAADNPSYWVGLGASMTTQTLIAAVLNYMKLPQAQRNDLLTVLTHPLYKFIDANLGTLSFLIALLKEIPGKQPCHSIEFRISHDTLQRPDALLPDTPSSAHDGCISRDWPQLTS